MARTQPNVLVVMYDQLTPSALGCYGNPVVRSPHIDALASSGVVFDAAYANSPLCSPARSCMMTGQLPSATGAYDNASYWPSTVPSVAHYLRAAGYRTLLTGKMHFVGPDQLHGFEERRTTDIYPADFGWTPDWRHPEERIDWWYHNMSSVTGAGVAEVTNQLLYDDEVGHQAVRALYDIARQDDGRPFFAVASFTHPHDPYVARQRYWDLYDGVDIPLPTVSAADVRGFDPHGERLASMCDRDNSVINDDDVRRARRAYLANVSYVDEWTGRLMDALGALELAEDTVVVLVSDHGDMLGERGHWYKMSFFEGSCRIPLVIHAPGRLSPGRVAEPVSLVDFLPTMLDLAGVSGEEPVDELAGVSVLPLCDGSPPASPRTVVGEYLGEGAVAPMVMIRRGPWKFVHSPGDPDQLYDLAVDPHELANLAAEPAHAALAAELRDEVARRWDLEALRQRVLADQDRRRLLTRALRSGRFTPWDYTPPRDDASEYMRNHLDLNEVERRARWPR
jgi:choline-sulfatase